MIDKILKNLKYAFINHKMVNEVSDQPLLEYENKPVKYPFVNIDLTNANVTKGVVNYTLNIHILDRQMNGVSQIVSYAKCEKILNEVIKGVYNKNNYSINFLTDRFPDIVSGCQTTLIIEDKLANVICDYENMMNNIITENNNLFIITEKDEYIKTEKQFIKNIYDIVYFGTTMQGNNDINEKGVDSGVLKYSKFLNVNDSNIITLPSTTTDDLMIIAIPNTYMITLVEDENDLWNDFTPNTIIIGNQTVIKNGIETEYDVYGYSLSAPHTREHKYLITINKNE